MLKIAGRRHHETKVQDHCYSERFAGNGRVFRWVPEDGSLKALFRANGKSELGLFEKRFLFSNLPFWHTVRSYILCIFSRH